MANHNDIIGKEKAQFYHQMVQNALPQGSDLYAKTIDKIQDKETIIANGKQLATLIAVQKCKDACRCSDKLFHIFPPVREIWKTIESKVEETTK